MPLISVIVPCYNTDEKYLIDLVNSLMDVKEKVEVIIIDDSSSGSVYFEGFDSFPYLRYEKNKKNMGLAYSYKKGFEISSGDLVCTLDHDDISMLSEVIDEVIESYHKGYNLIYTNETKFDESGNEYLFDKPNFDICSAIYYFYPHHYTFYLGSLAREVVKSVDLDMLSSAFDLCFYYNYLIALNSNLKVKHIPKSSYNWRIHGGSTAASIDQKPMHVRDRVLIAQNVLCQRTGAIAEFSVEPEMPFVLKAHFLDLAHIINKLEIDIDFKRKLTKIPFNYLRFMGLKEYNIFFIEESQITRLSESMKEKYDKHLFKRLVIHHNGYVGDLSPIYSFRDGVLLKEASNIKDSIVIFT